MRRRGRQWSMMHRYLFGSLLPLTTYSFFLFPPQLFLTFSGLVSRPPDICPTWFILCASVGLSSPWAIYVKRGEHFPLKCILTDNLA